MEYFRLSVFWWIVGTKRSLWPTPMFLKTKSRKNMNSQKSAAYSKLTTRRLCRGVTSKSTSKFDLRWLWMLVFHFLLLPNMA